MKNENEERTQQTDSVMLMETTDQVQTAIVTDILRQEGIASYSQSRDIGGPLDAYVGYSSYGDYIYVDSADLAKAKDLVEDFIPAD